MTVPLTAASLLSAACIVLLNRFTPITASFNIPSYIGAFILLITTFRAFGSFVQDVQESRAAARLGAHRVRKYRSWLPFGIDTFVRTRLGNKNDRYPGETSGKIREATGGIIADINVLGQRVISTVDSKHEAQILAGNFQNYGKTAQFMKVFKDILGEGVFNSDQRGLWKFHRTLTRPHFARESVTDFTHFAGHNDILMSYLSKQSKKGEAIDIQEAFGRYTFDVGTELFCGVSASSLLEIEDDHSVAPAKGSATEFLHAFLGAQKHGTNRARLFTLWPLLELFGNPNKENMDTLQRHLDSVIQRNLTKPREADAKKEALVHHLVAETQDIKLIRDELLNILIAARDTTASLLTSITYELARHPEVWQKLEAEVMQVMKDPDFMPTYEDLKDCKYLKAVIHETLRFYPPVFNNSRWSFAEDVLVGNDGVRYYIPPHTAVRYEIGAIQRSKASWGPDADVWDPERWNDKRIEYMTKNPSVFQPFSAGPRICLGQKFALNETTFTLARLIQGFSKVSLAADVQPPKTILPNGEVKIVGGLTMSFRGGLWVRLTPRARGEEAV